MPAPVQGISRHPESTSPRCLISVSAYSNRDLTVSDLCIHGSMFRRPATCLLVVVAAALLMDTCTVSAHRIPRPLPPVLRLGGEVSAWERGGRIRARGGSEPGGGAAAARRLGQRASLDNPPSPRPHGSSVPDPPPPPSSVNE